MTDTEKKQYCAELLRNCYAALREAGEDRYPRRSDFSGEEVVAVKACFGPWPRALEAAGIKPVDPERQAAREKRRIAVKRAATRKKLERKNGEKQAFP